MRTNSLIFWQLLIRTLGVCALFFGCSMSLVADSFAPDRIDIEHQLKDRAEKYLHSVRNQSAFASKESRNRIEQHAQRVIIKGLAKINVTDGSVSRTTTFEPNSGEASTVLTQCVRFLSHTGLENALGFLGRNFCQPSEKLITAHIAFSSPILLERVCGILSQSSSSGNSSESFVGLEVSRCAAIVVPSLNRILDRIIGSLAVCIDLPFVGQSVACFSQNENLLSGFPLIAQTVILRN